MKSTALKTFQTLIKAIRQEAGLTQGQFAKKLGVSTILVSMVEVGQKEVSKSFITKLAKLLDVHPASITPFLFLKEGESFDVRNAVEKLLVQFGEKMQDILIKQKAKKLSK